MPIRIAAIVSEAVRPTTAPAAIAAASARTGSRQVLHRTKQTSKTHSTRFIEIFISKTPLT